MGKFAELCKGRTMGAFFLLLLRRFEQFGHYAFMPGGDHLMIERNPVTYHRRRKLNLRHGVLFTQLRQDFPSAKQWLPH